MSSSPLMLDAGVVTRCRRRVHLEHDAERTAAPVPAEDPAAEQRMADAAAHRARIGAALAARFGEQVVTVDLAADAATRRAATEAAMAAGAPFVYNAALPSDEDHGRRGGVQLLVRAEAGYLPVLVVRHRVSDPGGGARTSPVADPRYAASAVDPRRKARPQARDQLRLAHAWRMLEACGAAAPGTPRGGVIGLDADVVVWHDLAASSWPGGRSTLAEYDLRFADRLAIASAARRGDTPLAQPSRITECRHCPWWPTCGAQLHAARDVSLVVRGDGADLLRTAGIRTVDDLAAADRGDPGVLGQPAMYDAVVLARAWLADLSMVRRVPQVRVPRADVEVDVDMESFGDSGAYLWGALLSGADIGMTPGYRAFVTWEPLPTADEARSFARFWRWFAEVRARCAARGLTVRAYCYNELAENRWLLASADRFAGAPGVPPRAEVSRFIGSDRWVDLFQAVSAQFLCARGKGLKVVAPVAGFAWRDPEAGGENSMRWYRAAVGMDGAPPDLSQRDRLLAYNEDDVRATFALRTWMSGAAAALPHTEDL